jgi:prevent-host-death family protein
MKPTRTVNIHEAKTHLSRLIEEAVQGEPFIIAKSGKPVVKVTAVDAPAPPAVRRTGFLAGHIAVPADFDQIGAEEIAGTFDGTR